MSSHQERMHEAVMACLRARGLDNPEALADATGMATLTAKALLGRGILPIIESNWLIDKLGLPVTVGWKCECACHRVEGVRHLVACCAKSGQVTE